MGVRVFLDPAPPFPCIRERRKILTEFLRRERTGTLDFFLLRAFLNPLRRRRPRPFLAFIAYETFSVVLIESVFLKTFSIPAQSLSSVLHPVIRQQSYLFS